MPPTQSTSPDATNVTGTQQTQETTNAPEGGAELFETPEVQGEQPPKETAAEGETEIVEGGQSAGTKPSFNLSKEDLQEILTGAMEKAGQPGKQQQQSEQPVEQKWTQEDFDKAFNVFKFTPEFMAALRGEDQQAALAALHGMRDGLIRQAMTMAEYRVQQHINTLKTTAIDPIQSFVTEQQATSFRNDFFKTYPDLEKYEAVVDAVSAKLQQSGYQGESRKAVMEKFAEETQKIVNQLKSAGGNGGVQQQTTGTKQGQRKMSTLTGGGQTTGGGRTQSQGPKGPAGIEVFDD